MWSSDIWLMILCFGDPKRHQVFGCTGEKWQKRRKLLTPAFHFQILKNYTPIFNEHAAVFVDVIRKESRSDQAFNICNSVTALTLDAICETAMGKKLNSQMQASEYADAVFQYSQYVIYRAFRPWLWPDFAFALTHVGRKAGKLLQLLHHFTITVIKERESQLSLERDDAVSEVYDDDFANEGAKAKKPFLDLLLELKAKGEISLDGVREEVDTFMFEGHDTTAAGIMWSIYCIATHRNVQTQLQEEVDAVFENVGNMHVTDDNLRSMPYLECVLRECQRLYPSVPVVARRITHDLELDGIKIPKGVNVNVNIIGLHRNPEHYPDPMRFDPSRFDPYHSEHRHPFAYVPFSAGPRNCIGQRFATLEMKVVLCHVLRHFDMEAVQDPDSMRPAMQLVLKPSNGIWIKFKDRIAK